MRPEGQWFVACPLVAAELLAALPVELAPAAGMPPPMTSATAGPASPAATTAATATAAAPSRQQLGSNPAAGKSGCTSKRQLEQRANSAEDLHSYAFIQARNACD